MRGAGLFGPNKWLVIATCFGFWITACASASAQRSNTDAEIKKIESDLKVQERKIAEQGRRLKAQISAVKQQSLTIDAQRGEIGQLQTEIAKAPAEGFSTVAAVGGRPREAETFSGARSPGASTGPIVVGQTKVAEASPSALPGADRTPDGPVGEASKDDQTPQVIQSLPQGLAVLTPAGHFILTPSLEYTQATANCLVYEGVVIVPGINLGEVTATTDDRSIFSAVSDVRYGITDRLEVELRVPIEFSDDRATVLNQGPQGSATQSVYLSGKGIGDINAGARYQINDGAEDWPIFIANLRTNIDTGIGPFNIKRNAAGIAEGVALGSGFLGAQAGFSMLKISDPVVLFSSLNYVYQIPRDVNETIGSTYVGRVEPSDSVNAALGFGFAVNSDFSFSLGYSHSYVFPQITDLGGTRQTTTSLEVGSLTMGMAYKLRQNTSLNVNFQFGVTADAPNMYMVISLPTSF